MEIYWLLSGPRFGERGERTGFHRDLFLFSGSQDFWSYMEGSQNGVHQENQNFSVHLRDFEWNDQHSLPALRGLGHQLHCQCLCESAGADLGKKVRGRQRGHFTDYRKAGPFGKCHQAAHPRYHHLTPACFPPPPCRLLCAVPVLSRRSCVCVRVTFLSPSGRAMPQPGRAGGCAEAAVRVGVPGGPLPEPGCGRRGGTGPPPLPPSSRTRRRAGPPAAGSRPRPTGLGSGAARPGRWAAAAPPGRARPDAVINLTSAPCLAEVGGVRGEGSARRAGQPLPTLLLSSFFCVWYCSFPKWVAARGIFVLPL